MKKELSTVKTMTVREIADTLGVAKSTVRNIVNRHGWASNGKTTHLNENQVIMLKKELVPRNLTLKSKVEKVNTELEMKQKAAEVIQWYMTSYEQEKQLRLQAETKSEALQVELDRSKEWYSIKRMEKLNKGQHFDWRVLKNESKKMGIDVKKVFDANYGEVNAYHVSVWESLYFDTLNYE